MRFIHTHVYTLMIYKQLFLLTCICTIAKDITYSVTRRRRLKRRQRRRREEEDDDDEEDEKEEEEEEKDTKNKYRTKNVYHCNIHISY